MLTKFLLLGSDAIPFAQQVEPEHLEAPINWVFYMSIVIGLGFFAFLGFLFLYYVVGVLAKNRRLAVVAPVASVAAPAARVPVAATAPAATAPAATAPAAASPAAAQAPASTPAPQAAAATAPAPSTASAEPAGGVPKINPTILPDGIDAVTRGRLKKLAILQERGTAPSKELIESIKDTLEQMAGAPIDVDAATAAPAPAPAAPAPATAAPAPAPAAPAPAAAPPTEPTPPAAEPAPAAESLPAEPAAPAAESPPAEPAEAELTAGETFGLPRVDPNNLPAGLDPVAKGRMKKLAIFQQRGKKPPDELVEALKSILDTLSA